MLDTPMFRSGLMSLNTVLLVAGIAYGTAKADSSNAQSQSLVQSSANAGQIQMIQRSLNALSLRDGAPNGIEDENTRRAIRAFQAQAGFPVTGVLAPYEFDFLMQSAADLAAGNGTTKKDAQRIPRSSPAGGTNEHSESLSEQPATTTPPEPVFTEVNEGGIVYHRMDRCAYDSGIANATYRLKDLTRAYGNPVLELTDFCFDRATGRLWASEPFLEGLKLTLNQVWGDTYEKIFPGSVRFERWKLTIGNYAGSGAGIEGERSAYTTFGFFRDSTKFNNYAYTGTRHEGYININGMAYETRPEAVAPELSFRVHLSMFDELQNRRMRADTTIRSRATPYLAFEGDLIVKDGVGHAKLSPSEGSDREGNGALTVTVTEDGSLKGSGTASLTNNRLAGIGEHDWRQANLVIEHFVGHLVGDTDQVMIAVGYVTGTVIDQDGYENEVLGTIQLRGHGSGGSQDLALETLLDRLGFDPGPIDGELDRQALSAIRDFQTQFGLPHHNPVPDEQISVLRAVERARFPKGEQAQ